MKFGLYIHIPHCLQQCTYCDFATIQNNNEEHISEYIQLLEKEFQFYSSSIPLKKIDTIYFGGGTPSLVPNRLLVSLLNTIRNNDFMISPDVEITLEINPGTLSITEIEELKEAGFNRFSVGVQTFDEELLDKTGRKHSAQDSRDTLSHLKESHTLFTADILFGLPGQKISGLEKDLKEFLSYSPPHLSAYNLTIPEKHPMMVGRADDREQVAMYRTIEETLKKQGLSRYELSNYALQGKESKHNQIYWQDQAYLGLGMSAHSYFPKNISKESWGVRFSNPLTLPQYKKWVLSLEEKPQSLLQQRPSHLIEKLKLHEYTSDYCHISLRKMRGFCKDEAQTKLPDFVLTQVEKRMESLVQQGLIEQKGSFWCLSEEGKVLSNRVFAELTFLSEDL